MGFKNTLPSSKKKKRDSKIQVYIYMYIQINNISNTFNVDHKYFLSESLSGKVKRASALPD